MRFSLGKRAVMVAVLAMLCSLQGRAASQWVPPSPASASSIPQSQLIQPDELNRLLQAHGVERPLILQVGSHVLFAQAHIAGSEYAGPGSQDAGLQQLRARVGPLPRKTLIVIYCGCCPWNRCPNLGPAYKALTDMGFTRVKALYLADNLGADWADKGFPVETGR
jgi:thiosulfate/3-mercaptopyruvate sulfurtransferase